MDIKNYTNQDGSCSENCGRCCTPVLPVNEYELKKIKKFLQRNPIEPNVDPGACPFLTEEKKCSIYLHRPEICQCYTCNAPLTNFYHFDKAIKNLREEFFPEQAKNELYDVKKLNMEYQIRKNRAQGKK